MLRLAALLSSSSEEMLTTIWADIVGCRSLPRLVSLGFGIRQAFKQWKKRLQVRAPQLSLLRIYEEVVSYVVGPKLELIY